jgi:hypothetical protein
MKKLIVTIICVLFVSTSFAQMVGSSSVSKETKPKEKLRVKKHEFSIHGGAGLEEFDDITFLGTMKYKLKPFKKFEIRLLGEVGVLYPMSNYDFIKLPVLVGINYECRLSKNWSIFMDLGAGVSIPLTNYRKVNVDYDTYRGGNYNHYMRSTHYRDNFGIGYVLSPEIGFSYRKFIFSFKYVYALNSCRENTLVEWHYDFNNNYNEYFDGPYSESVIVNGDESVYDYGYFLFTLGFRF